MSLTLRSRNSLQTQKPSSKDQIICDIHNEYIIKVCLQPDCKYNNIIFCAQCIVKDTKHLGMHKDTIINIQDFFKLAKQLSLQYKNKYDGAFTDKEFHSILAKLEKEQLQYKKHIKIQEDYVEQQFNIIQENIWEQFNEMKNHLKLKFQEHLKFFESKCEKLKIRANDLNQDRLSNKDYKNEFDNLLDNLNSKKSNLKKLMTNVYPLMKKLQTKQLQQTQDTKQSFVNDEQSIYTSFTQQSILTLNLQNNPYLTPLNDQFQEIKTLISEKPEFKINNSSCEKWIDDINYQINKIKNQFLEQMQDYIRINAKKQESNNLITLASDDFTPRDIKANNIFQNKKQRISYQDYVQTNFIGISQILHLDDYNFLLASGKIISTWRYDNFQFEKQITMPYEITYLDRLKRQDGSCMTVVGMAKGFLLLNQAQEIYRQYDSEHSTGILQIIALNDFESVITISTNDNKIVLQNLFQNSFKSRKYYDHKDNVQCLDLNNQINTIVSGSKDRSIKIWKIMQGNLKINPNYSVDQLQLDYTINDCHITEITALKIGQLYDIVISGSANGEIKIWDLKLGKQLRQLKNFSGWVYKLYLFEQPHADDNNFTTNCSTKQKIQIQRQSKSNFLKNVQFLSISFDGMIKLWGNNDEPIQQIHNKTNIQQCYPFGGVSLIENQNKICLMTSGFKQDKNMQIFNIE